MALTLWSNKKEKKPLNSVDLQAIQLLTALNEQCLTASGETVLSYLTTIIAGSDEGQVGKLKQSLLDLRTLEHFLVLLDEIEALRTLVDNSVKIDSSNMSEEIENEIVGKFVLIKTTLDLIGVKPEFSFDDTVSASFQRRMILHSITDAINDAWPKVTEAHSRLNNNLLPLMQRVANATIDNTDDLLARVTRLQTQWKVFAKYNESLAILNNPKYNFANFFYRRALAKLELDVVNARKVLDAVTPSDFSLKTSDKFKGALQKFVKADDALRLTRLQALFGPWANEIQKKEQEIEVTKLSALKVKPLYDNWFWNIITGTTKRDQYNALIVKNQGLSTEINTLTETANQKRGNITRDESFKFVTRYIPDSLFARINAPFKNKRSLSVELPVSVPVPVAVPVPATKKNAQEIENAKRFAEKLSTSIFNFRDLKKHLLTVTEFGDVESNRKLSQWIRKIKDNIEPAMEGETKKTAHGDGSTNKKTNCKLFEWLDAKGDETTNKINGLAFYLETKGYNEADTELSVIFDENLGTIQDSVEALDAVFKTPDSYRAPTDIEKRYQFKGNFALNIIRILLTGDAEQVANLNAQLSDLYRRYGASTTSELPFIIGEIMQHWKPLVADGSEVEVNIVWEERYERRKPVIVATSASTNTPTTRVWGDIYDTLKGATERFIYATAPAPAVRPVAGKGF